MNILLNNYCNLNCSYCFANHVLEQDRLNMSLEDIAKVIEFSKNSDVRSINLIGGEPTLHPEFIKIIDKILQEEYFEQLLLFTNGLFNKNILNKLLSFSEVMNLRILINYNHLNSKLTEIIDSNIEALKDVAQITLGINFYKQSQDFDYIIDTSKKYGLKNIRWSLVVPNNELKSNVDVKKYFINHKNTIIDFLEKCLENEITPHVDCNNFPLCILNEKELRIFACSSETNLRVSVCPPVIDVLPDLRVIRCFVFSDYEVNLTDFSNLADLISYFEKSIDNKFKKHTII